MRGALRLSLALVAASLVAPPGGGVEAQDTLLATARREAAAGRPAAAEAAYRLLLQRSPDDPAALGELADLLESVGRWREAIPPLQHLVALAPDTGGGRRLRQLGQFLAWSGERDRGTTLLRRALALQPRDPEAAAALGEVLSWTPTSRPEAAELFERALAADSTNFRALEGRANLMAWGGQAQESLRAYDALLERDPRSLGALRGKGGALNQLGRYGEAAAVLDQALALAPNDPGALQELVQAQVGLGRFDQANRVLRLLAGEQSPALDDLRQATRRGRSAFLETTGLARDRQRQLDAIGGGARLSVPLGPALSLSGRGERIRYRAAGGDFDATTAGLGLTLSRGRRVRLGLSGAARWIDGRDGTEWDGSAAVSVAPNRHVELLVEGTRELVEESRRSVQLGAHSNLAAVGLRLTELPFHLDFEGRAFGGTYEADGLESNTRLGGEVRVGYVLRRARPWLRLSYGFVGTGFEFNAGETSPTRPDDVGGYFSPSRFYLNYGGLSASDRLGARVFWELDGRLGGQIVRPRKGERQDTRAAGTVWTHVVVRVLRGWDLDAQYVYADSFNAFRLSEGRLGLRRYF